jgi:hypothetical protein
MAGGPAPVELLADCPRCGLEAGVVEIYDAFVPACRFGIPASATCRLCGTRVEGTFDRSVETPMRDVEANRCPACLAELAPSALDERRCRSCGGAAALAPRAEPRPLTTEDELREALDEWASREGFTSRDELLTTTFCEPDLRTIHARLVAGERLEVVVDPFASMGMRPAASAEARARSRPPPHATSPHTATNGQRKKPFDPTVTEIDPFAALAVAPTDPLAAPMTPRVSSTPSGPASPHRSSPPRSADPPPRSAPPRAIVFPLVSVVAADGEVHPAERALVDRFLESEGLAPLADDEFRVHHPDVVAHFVPKERREAVVQLMCETAAADGMPDESERRVIRAYANAWSVPDEKVDFWMWGYENMSASLGRQLWLKIRRFVLSARWSDERKEGR